MPTEKDCNKVLSRICNYLAQTEIAYAPYLVERIVKVLEDADLVKINEKGFVEIVELPEPVRLLRVRIENDQDTENPMDYSAWEFHSFLNRRRGSDSAEDFLTAHNGNVYFKEHEHRKKYNKNEAFILDYFEHGSCQWKIQSNGGCQWDTSRSAGIMILKDGEYSEDVSEEKKLEYAKNALESYTDWCNGNCHWISVEFWDEDSRDWEPLESLGGIIGYDDLIYHAAELVRQVNATAEEWEILTVDSLHGSDMEKEDLADKLKTMAESQNQILVEG